MYVGIIFPASAYVFTERENGSSLSALIFSKAGTSAHFSVRKAFPSASFTSQLRKSSAACLCSSDVASELSTKMYLEPPPTSFVFVPSVVFCGTGIIPRFSV